MDGLSSQIRSFTENHRRPRGKTTLFLRTGSGILHGKNRGRRDSGHQSGRYGAQERRRASDGGTHEYRHVHGCSGSLGPGTFHLRALDQAHATTAVGLERRHPQAGEGNFDTRAHVQGNDELARLGHDFNAMAARLAEYRKSSLGELLQAHLSMQAAIDSLPDPVAIFSVEGNLQNVNHAAETLLGLKADSASKDPLKNVNQPTGAVLERIRSHVLSGKGAYVPRGFEDAVQLTTLLGDRYFLPRGSPVYETRGVVVGATVILQDVTRLRRFEELKNDLVATVAHEFRTPLTSLRMAVHLCTEQVAGPLTDKQAELLHAAREDCDRLQAMVDDLLDLSRIESGRVELFPLPTPVSHLVESAIEEHKAEAIEAGLNLSSDFPLPEARVLADHERIGHVFSNLIVNAVRHTPKGGSLTLGAEVVNDAVRFTVADTGKGIPREYQERIFEKFFRVPDAEPRGTGLGLYIAREIVRGHGGDIGVKSEPGKGSTFWFTLRSASKAASKGE